MPHPLAGAERRATCAGQVRLIADSGGATGWETAVAVQMGPPAQGWVEERGVLHAEAVWECMWVRPSANATIAGWD
jgi:hypothetical protein